MPASRWHSSFSELFQWIGEGDEELLSLLMPSVFTRFSQKDPGFPKSELPSIEESSKFPTILPILPLRGVVVYPNTAVPLTVGQPRSVKLVDDVVAGNKLVGLVAAKNPELEVPGPADLFQVGTIGTEKTRTANGFSDFYESAVKVFM